MSIQTALSVHDARNRFRRIQYWKRILLTLFCAIILHFILIYYIFPKLEITPKNLNPTEVVQISQEELSKIKNQIKKNKFLPPLLQQELNEKFKTKDAPKNAKFIAPFNQSVPEETVAGAQSAEPLAGGGKPKPETKSKDQNSKKDISLSKIGLGETLPKKTEAETNESNSPISGPPGPFRPVGRDDPKLKKSGNNLLNAVENQYYSFFVRFEEPIIRNWYFLMRSYEARIRSEFEQKKLGDGAELPVTLEFTIDRSGNFLSIDILSSSGIPTLDWATRESVKKLGNLPNPPPALFEGKPTFSYQLQFVVYLSNAPMINSSPELNWR